MSVLFLPPPSASAVPDASETVSGKIRIATSAEATTGTNDLTAMTPAKVKTVVDAAVVGGVTYKGTFDTSSPVDLSNALKGDMYVISVAGTYQGIVWAVGDHLLINEDMGGTISPSKIDKVDNSDLVTSVAGKTGAVTLVPADVTGLATVASTGAYSDLSGTPTLATVATTGAYSDLTGTPSLATVATTGAYSDLSGTPTLAAVATSGAYSDLTGTPDPVAFETIEITGPTTLSSSLDDGCYLIVFTSTATVTIPAYAAGKNLVFRFANFGTGGSCTIQQASAATRIYEFGDYGLTGVNSITLASGDTRTLQLYAAGSTLATNYWTEANPSTAGGASTLGALTDVDVTGAVNTNVIKYNSTSGNWEDGAVAYSEVTGTPALATVATTGAYSDLSGTPTLATVATTGAYSDLSGTPTLGTAAALDVGTSANNVVQLDGSARLPAVDGSQLTGLPSAGIPALTSAAPGSTYSITTSAGFMEVYLLTPTVACAVTIPTASSAGSGYRYNIKNNSTYTVTISPSSGTIDAAASFSLPVQYSAVTLVSDGSNWFVL